METYTTEEDPMIEGIDDHFQIEILKGELVYACNICDEGFDIEDKIKKHIAFNHKDILIEISKNVEEEEDDKDELEGDLVEIFCQQEYRKYR